MRTPNVDLEPILKKYIGKKLFKNEQDTFKEEFFKELFDPYAYVDYSKRTTLFINTILEEEDLPYIFAVDTVCDNEELFEHAGEKYWILRKL
jgi:hypothetical protein